jgi:hypothetical protein
LRRRADAGRGMQSSETEPLGLVELARAYVEGIGVCDTTKRLPLQQIVDLAVTSGGRESTNEFVESLSLAVEIPKLLAEGRYARDPRLVAEALTVAAWKLSR